jgi:hypothetical protein
MVRCVSGHQPLAMYGRTRKRHTYMTCDYGRAYGRTAAEAIEGHGQWLSVREDAILPLVERFFCERIFGPMRVDKLARQLRAHKRATAKRANGTQLRLRDEVGERDRRIGLQIEALEAGVEPGLVGKALRSSGRTRKRPKSSSAPSPPSGPILWRRRRRPRSSRGFPTWEKRYAGLPWNSSGRCSRPFASRSPTTSRAGGSRSPPPSPRPRLRALENAEGLPEEAFDVPQRDIAGARFVPSSDTRILHQFRLAA